MSFIKRLGHNLIGYADDLRYENKVPVMQVHISNSIMIQIQVNSPD